MNAPYNPLPLLEALLEEDLLQLADMLDEQVQVLVSHAEREGIGFAHISDRVHLLRLLRDAFLKSAGQKWR